MYFVQINKIHKSPMSNILQRSPKQIPLIYLYIKKNY